MATKPVHAPIPKLIRVGRKKYSVEIVEAMLEKKCMARVYYPENLIRLAQHSNISGRRFTEEEVQDSFWHEVVHAILHDMGRHTLNNNEQFVTEFANRLTQAINTAKFK